MTQQKFIFKNKEVIIKCPLTSNTLNLGDFWTEEAKVLFVGEQQEKYKAGDTIIYVHVKGMEKDRGRVLKLNGEDIMVLEESRITCQVINE